jgi:biopolymer transport protein ExbB
MRHLLWLFVIGIVLQLRGATFDDVQTSAAGDLRAALDELVALQEQIGEQKIPLARRLTELEEQVVTRRKELERAQRSHENQLVDLNVLKSEVKRARDENGYLTSLLAEFTRLFETRIHISELQVHRAPIENAKLAAASANLLPSEQVQQQAALVEAALNRIEALQGGHTFEGQALTESGKLERGRFLLVGPVAVYSSGQSDSAGLVELQLGSTEPTVIALEANETTQIKTLLKSNRGDLPVDPSLGNAVKIAATKDGFFEHIKKGGVVMVPIILLAIASIAVALVKWLQLARIRVATPADLQAVLERIDAGEIDQARAHARNMGGPSGALLEIAIDHAREKKELIEEVLYEKMLHLKPRLERSLPFLALTAAAAPLLGLLGTVTGMISTFNMISVFGTGDPKTLSGGISEALITTEWGLLVSIPALLLHAVLNRKVKGILGGMEQISVGFINGVPEREEEKLVF